MSFLSRLMGGTFDSNMADADGYFRAGQFGDAKLSYERALKKSSDAPQSTVDTVRKQIAECRRILAQQRIQNAEKFLEDDDTAMAASELDNALEIDNDPAISAQVKQLRARIEAMTARAMVDGEDEMSEEELLAVIAGTWSTPRAEEYNRLPEEFFTALIAAHDGDRATAIQCIDGLIKAHDNSFSLCFLYYEKGLQTLAAGDLEAAESAFQTFTDTVTEDPESTEERLTAHTLLSSIFERTERAEKAEEELKRAVKVAPKSHIPLLNLGIFLRSRKEYERALQALENARVIMGSLHPDVRVFRELGLTCAAMEQKKNAIDWLESVVKHATAAGSHDEIDPEAGVALAKLYESNGQLNEACDLFRHLAAGHDRRNHFAYNVESVRLLRATGADERTIAAYIARARELAANETEKGTADLLAAPSGE